LQSEADQLTIDARRSLRASRERRGAALRRRRLLRGRRAALAVAGVFALTAGGALAAPGDTDKLPPTTVKQAQRALAVKADGVVGPRTKRAIRRYQRSKGLSVDGLLGESTLQSLGVSSDAASGASPPAQANADSNGGEEASDAGDPTQDADVPATDTPPAPTPSQAATLESIADCESGGDPTAISPTGQYRGKYQFDRQTWQHMGGTGDPAAAPEAEQDARAAQLLARRGTAPWPVCG
jgi:peptidoglycan hydrolase-like protein with peptidoglycan-binding domain